MTEIGRNGFPIYSPIETAMRVAATRERWERAQERRRARWEATAERMRQKYLPLNAWRWKPIDAALRKARNPVGKERG